MSLCNSCGFVGWDSLDPPLRTDSTPRGAPKGELLEIRREDRYDHVQQHKSLSRAYCLKGRTEFASLNHPFADPEQKGECRAHFDYRAGHSPQEHQEMEREDRRDAATHDLQKWVVRVNATAIVAAAVLAATLSFLLSHFF